MLEALKYLRDSGSTFKFISANSASLATCVRGLCMHVVVICVRVCTFGKAKQAGRPIMLHSPPAVGGVQYAADNQHALPSYYARRAQPTLSGS